MNWIITLDRKIEDNPNSFYGNYRAAVAYAEYLIEDGVAQCVSLVSENGHRIDRQAEGFRCRVENEGTYLVMRQTCDDYEDAHAAFVDTCRIFEREGKKLPVYVRLEEIREGQVMLIDGCNFNV